MYISADWGRLPHCVLCDAIRQHISGSTLAQVMTPCHYRNESWPKSKCVQWHSPESNLQVFTNLIYNMCLKIRLSKITATSPRGQWVNVLAPGKMATNFAGIGLKWHIYLKGNIAFLMNISQQFVSNCYVENNPDSKVHGSNMGPTWVLSAPDGPHIGPMNLGIREGMLIICHFWFRRWLSAKKARNNLYLN